MKILPAIATIFAGLVLATTLHAHRVEGLLQASLVEILPSQVGVEVTLAPGIDVAPKIFALLDTNGDGGFSEIESVVWSELFMARQSVTVDGQSLPLNLKSIRTTPLAEMTNGHAEIVVYFTADLGRLARGPRTIVCANRYEPISCSFQSNGLVPRAPGVRISSHRRDDRQQEVILAAEFTDLAAPAPQTAQSSNIIPQHRAAVAIPWLISLSVAGAIVAAMVRRRQWSAKAEL